MGDKTTEKFGFSLGEIVGRIYSKECLLNKSLRKVTHQWQFALSHCFQIMNSI